MQCAECKKDFHKNKLTQCEHPDDSQPDGNAVEYLCEECLDKSVWYCHHCGQFCAGITSFEFGPYAGFCDNCVDQMKDRDYTGEEDEFDFSEFPDYPPHE